MKSFSTILLAFTMLFMTGCATLFTGTKDVISFNSTPSGAVIYIDGVEQCITPCEIDVKRSIQAKTVEFKLDGYETKLITLSRDFNIVSVLNLGNLFGWAIDAVTGSVTKYDKKSYNVRFDSKTSSVINPTRINIDTEKKIVELYVAENNR